MHPVDRRGFLGSFAAALAAGPVLLGQEPKPKADELPVGPFQPDTLFLTWQRDPTTTMTVQWVGSKWETNDDTVFVSPLDAPNAAVIGPAAAAVPPWRPVPTRTKPFPMTDLKVFRAEITGLKPGTEYRFRIGTQSPTYRFRTMPAKATDALHFVSGGDCGVNPHAAAINALAAKQDPYFALIGGDLAYDNGRSPVTFLGFLKNYSKHMVDSQGRMVPLVAGIGNHEVNGGYGKAREKAPHFLAVFDGLYAERTFATLDFGDYLSLVLLDTGHVAKIGGEQTAWLDRALADRRDRPHLIVANHVPAYPSFRPPTAGLLSKAGTGEENRTHWVPLFEKHNVDVVLEHHDHTFKRTHPLKDGLRDPNGVLYLGDGSWGQLRAPKSPEKRPYLAAVGQAYHFTLHRLEGEQRFHLAMEESGKVADICTTRKKPRGVVRAG